MAEISAVGLLGIFITYFLDRSKRSEIRNANLLNIRNKIYSTILKEMRPEVDSTNARIKMLVGEYEEVKNGRAHTPTAKIEINWLFEDQADSLIYGSSPFVNMLGTIKTGIASVHIILNHWSEMYDPEGVVEIDGKMFSAKISEKEMNLWIEKIRVFQQMINTSATLIERQHRSELARLMPKDTIRHRVQDRRQSKRNRKMIKKTMQDKLNEYGIRISKTNP